jgi:hypothetical protein
MDFDLHGDTHRVTFKIKADASEGQPKELVHLAQQRSPVFDIVSHPVPVKEKRCRQNQIKGQKEKHHGNQRNQRSDRGSRRDGCRGGMHDGLLHVLLL